MDRGPPLPHTRSGELSRVNAASAFVASVQEDSRFTHGVAAHIHKCTIHGRLEDAPSLRE